MKKISTLLFFLFYVVLFSQTYCNYKLSGKIADIHAGIPLDSTHIQLKNIETGFIYSTVSNPKGEYEISQICEGIYDITISHDGCNPKTFQLTINKNINKNFNLEHHIKEIEAVIAIAKIQSKTKTSTENKLSKKEIEAFSDTNLGTALSSIAGVNTLSTGNHIVKPVVHGMHSSRVPILNNGIRQEDQQWGIEHAPDIDLNMANSISIIKGAGALQYAGDATGGIVLVESKKLTTKDTLIGSVLTSYISNGKGGNISAHVEKGWGNGWAFRVQGTYKRLGDLSAPNYNLSNTGFKENDFSAQIGYRKNNFEIEGFYSFFGSETGILKAAHIGNLENLVTAINSREPSIITPFSNDINSPKQKIQHHLAKLSSSYSFDLGKINFTYGYQFNNRKEYDVRKFESKGRPSLDLDLETNDLNLNFEHKDIYGFKGKMGISYTYQENYPYSDTGISPLIPYYQKNNGGIYWVESYQLTPNFTLEGGFRYDYLKIEALKLYKKSRWENLGYDNKHSNLIIKDLGISLLTNPSLTYNGYAATLGGVYKFNNLGEIAINYSLSSRAPNPGELFSDGLHHSAAVIELGNIDLKNEKSNKIISTFKSHWFDYRLSLEISLHYNYIKDFINQIPTGAEYNIRGAFPVWEYLQTNAEIYGLDIMADYSINHNLSINSNFSYLKGNDIKNNTALINMPPTKWVNSIQYQNNKWMNFHAKLSSISMFKQNHYPDYNFKINVIENGEIISKFLDLSTPPSAYQLFDFATGFSLDITPINKLDLSFSIRNILNTSYRNYLNRLRYYADETGRNFILTAKYNF